MTSTNKIPTRHRQPSATPLLPPNAAEWRRRVRALTETLRTAHPGQGAMKTRTEAPGLPTVTCLCVDGVITTLAEREGAIHGEWTVSDYYPPGGIPNSELPMRVSADNPRVMECPRDATAAITCYEYCVTTPDGAPDGRHYPSHNVNSPPQARLWFGMDVNPEDGKHRIIALSELGETFRDGVRRQYGAEPPPDATMPQINDSLFAQGVNPLAVVADILENAIHRPITGLWHPDTVKLLLNGQEIA